MSEVTRIDGAPTLDYEYGQVFPEGHLLVKTSTYKYRCGTDALCKSSEQQHSLQFHIEEPQLQMHLQAAGVQGIDNFADEELAKLLFYLGRLENKILFLGIYYQGQPQKMIYRTKDAGADEYQVIWISNDMKGNVPGRMDHWSAMTPRRKTEAHALNVSDAKVESTEVSNGSAETTSPTRDTSSNQEDTARISSLEIVAPEFPEGRHVTFSADCKGPGASGSLKKHSPLFTRSATGGTAHAQTSEVVTLAPEPQLSLATPNAEPPQTIGEPTADFQQVDSMEGLDTGQDTSMSTEQIRDTGQPEPSTTTWERTEPPTWNANAPGQSGHQTDFVDDARDVEMGNAEVGVHKTLNATPTDGQPPESHSLLFNQGLDWNDAPEKSGGISTTNMLAEAFPEVPDQTMSSTAIIRPSTPLGESSLDATDRTEIMLDVPELHSLPENQFFDHNYQPAPTTTEVVVENIFPELPLEDWQALQQYMTVPPGSEDRYIASEDTLAAPTANNVYPGDCEVSGEDIATLIQEAADFADSLKNMDAPTPSQDVTTTWSGHTFLSDDWDSAGTLAPGSAVDMDGLANVEAQVVDEDEELRLNNAEMDRYFDFDAVYDSNGAVLDHHNVDSGEVPYGASTEVENNAYVAAFEQMESNPYSMPQVSPAYTQWQAPQPPSMSQSHATSATTCVDPALLDTDPLISDPSSAGYHNSTPFSSDTLHNLLHPPRPSTITSQSYTPSVNGDITSPPFIPGLTLSPPRPTTAAPNPKPDSPPSPVSYDSDYEEEEEPPLPEEVADRLRQKMNAQTHVTFYQSVPRDKDDMVRTGKNPGLSKMVREEAKTSLDHWSAELSRIKKTRYEKKDQQYKGHSEYIAIEREVDDVDLRRLRARIFQTAQARFDAAQWQARLELEEDVVEQQSPTLPTPPVSPMPPPPQSGFEFQTQTQVSFSTAASRNPNPKPNTNNRPLRFVKIGGEEEESDDDETV
ncbi:hypothetical protein LTR70_008946 [Exophiala xenobiotica]|uniref:Uncharacterized protein n=1 Tax=Lithohypha guttulata TaxID=1690604 RepID=A0ABR0K0Q2_9EURO|nr:hypothetical protein LTR24_008682 [Lithohypha guttulata]KAK5311183.1 hypothetical protein LTR70_008946 [Exophiala xenobiotica]